MKLTCKKINFVIHDEDTGIDYDVFFTGQRGGLTATIWQGRAIVGTYRYRAGLASETKALAVMKEYFRLNPSEA